MNVITNIRIAGTQVICDDETREKMRYKLQRLFKTKNVLFSYDTENDKND
jgi:hypothetical protein